MDWFSRLPDEVCLQVLQYVPQSELFKCMRVCHRWNTLSRDDTLWNEIQLRCERVNEGFLLKVASRWPRLKSLMFLGLYRYQLQPSCTDIMWGSIWERFDSLESVSFNSCLPLFINSIPSLIICCPKLKCLRCEHSPDFGRQHLVSILHPFRRYKELSLAYCTQIDDIEIDFTLKKYTNMFDCLKSLEILNLDGLQSMSDSSVIRILEKCPALKSLALDGEQLTDSVPQFIGSHLLHLQHLSISFCENLTDKSLLSFGALKSLKTLYLKKGEGLTNQAFEELFEQLHAPVGDKPMGGGLQSVSLIECWGLMDSSLRKLAENNHHLVHLDLSWCWNLTDAGLEAVATNCHEIKTLILVGLKDARCLPIVSGLMPRLQFLELVQTDLVDDDQLKLMKESKPWLKIIDYYGEEVGVD